VPSNSDVAQIIRVMKRRGLTLSTAESITGGGLGELFTSISGASAVYQGGIITYSDVSKTKFLGVIADSYKLGDIERVGLDHLAQGRIFRDLD